MNQRSFKLGDVTQQAKARRDFWQPDHESLSSSETNSAMSTESQDFHNNVQTAKPVSLDYKAELINNPNTPATRKAKPVNSPSEKKTPGPVLRPKGVPKPAVNPICLPSENNAAKETGVLNTPSTQPQPLAPKPQPFSERYERITTYLEKPLFTRVHELHQQGQFNKIASLINAAVREYLDRHYEGT